MGNQEDINSEEADKGMKTDIPLLDGISFPCDLRKLDVEQLPQVCREIRQAIISSLSNNPGHFASSMGAVEIITALHYVFNTPFDRIVWDVGHQAYAHKILTGRKDQLPTQRTLNGISGFPNPAESEYDTFICGHAGNSISAALGMAISDSLTPGNENRKTVAVVGDASISNGISFEGLNNASNNPNNLLIILNDNDMSIDNNVGALHKYLSEITTSAGYNRFRYHTSQFFNKIGMLPKSTKNRLLRLNNSVKSFISQQQNIFEGLNIRYFGPFNGHDVVKLVKILEEIKDMEGPRILHLCTTKGKGFATAEENPAVWHAPGKFNPVTGERGAKGSEPTPPLWQEIFGETLVELADSNPDVVGITAAMPSGTSINKLLKKYPKRAFDVGISEGHAVTFAGGLAAAGKRPFVAIYSSFLQRAYDNIIHDVAIQGLPVTFCIDRAGLVGEDGVTHHGLLDLAYLSAVPGMSIASPYDAETLRNLMFTSLDFNSPLAIRYPRGKSGSIDWHTEMRKIPVGKGRIMKESANARAAILSLGSIGKNALDAARLLEEKGIAADVYDMIWIKPLDMDIVNGLVGKYEVVLTLEDATVTGGLGSAVTNALANEKNAPVIIKAGVPDKWIAHGSVAELQKQAGIDSVSISEMIENALK